MLAIGVRGSRRLEIADRGLVRECVHAHTLSRGVGSLANERARFDAIAQSG
jgi:hypothetical protein